LTAGVATRQARRHRRGPTTREHPSSSSFARSPKGYRRLDKDQKPVPPVTHVSEIVIREVLPVPGGATLLALGMLRDLTAGRIDVWDLGKDKRETMKDTKKGA
jgi:hypothetical protein